jgi:endonuclease III related protein
VRKKPELLVYKIKLRSVTIVRKMPPHKHSRTLGEAAQGGLPLFPPRGMPLDAFFKALLGSYGPQGWWPLLDHAGSNPTSTGRLTGYHPGDFTFPRDENQRFEICVGAILTQNTAWPNVERALSLLQQGQLLSAQAILLAPDTVLEKAIRSSGYFRAKTKKLRAFAEFHARQGGRTPRRDQLLDVWGIGPETADSIRLYAYQQDEMVVDAYTVRVLCQHGYNREPLDYARAKRYCEDRVPRSVEVYQEFHALMVEHAKRLRAAGVGKKRG